MPDQTKPAIPSTPAAPVPMKPVKVINEKGAQYRIFHADGAWGVINSHGNLLVDFCVEHPPTPSAVIQPVKDGNFTGEQIMEGIDDPDYFVIIRDFQCGVILTYVSAVQLYGLLDTYIKATKQQMDDRIATLKQSK